MTKPTDETKPQTQRTPGPWTFRKDLSDEYGWQIIAPNGAQWRLPTQGTDTMGSEANVRLVAAAPDLLSALKTLLNYDTDYMSEDEARRIATAAIAKAEGR